MLKQLLVHIRYPYTAVIIAVLWIGSAVMVGIDSTAVSVNQVVLVNAVASILIAVVGFSNKRT